LSRGNGSVRVKSPAQKATCAGRRAKEHYSVSVTVGQTARGERSLPSARPDPSTLSGSSRARTNLAGTRPSGTDRSPCGAHSNPGAPTDLQQTLAQFVGGDLQVGVGHPFAVQADRALGDLPASLGVGRDQTGQGQQPGETDPPVHQVLFLEFVDRNVLGSLV